MAVAWFCETVMKPDKLGLFKRDVGLVSFCFIFCFFLCAGSVFFGLFHVGNINVVWCLSSCSLIACAGPQKRQQSFNRWLTG